MLGIIATLVMFLFIAPASRTLIFSSVSAAVEWILAWAPFSYLLVLIVIVSPLVSWHLVAHGPPLKEPDDPLAKYRHADDVSLD